MIIFIIVLKEAVLEFAGGLKNTNLQMVQVIDRKQMFLTAILFKHHSLQMGREIVFPISTIYIISGIFILTVIDMKLSKQMFFTISKTNETLKPYALKFLFFLFYFSIMKYNFILLKI